MDPAEASDQQPSRDQDPTIAYAPEAVDDSLAGEATIHGAFDFALVVERGARAGMAFVLAPGETTIGRSTKANIFLDDVTVSRRHAVVTMDDSGLRLADVGSLNGTYVNGERLDEAQLAPGDEVIVGKFHLVVVKGDG